MTNDITLAQDTYNKRAKREEAQAELERKAALYDELLSVAKATLSLSPALCASGASHSKYQADAAQDLRLVQHQAEAAVDHAEEKKS